MSSWGTMEAGPGDNRYERSINRGSAHEPLLPAESQLGRATTRNRANLLFSGQPSPEPAHIGHYLRIRARPRIPEADQRHQSAIMPD